MDLAICSGASWRRVGGAFAMVLAASWAEASGGGGHGAPPAADSHGGGHGEAPAAAHGGGHGAAQDEGESFKLKPGTIVIVEPRKFLDPELASEQVERYLESAEAEWRGRNFEMAERYYAAALGIPADVPEKEAVLMSMGKNYEKAGLVAKAIAVYERVVVEFPESRRKANVYMDLGDLYRDMGAPELAISTYHHVLNASLNVDLDQLESVKVLSDRAKMAIAATHEEKEEYSEAYHQYEAISHLELRPRDLMQVRYRMCYLLYKLGNYQLAVSKLKLFLEDYSESAHVSELRYLLAKSYEHLGRKPEALREVVGILQAQANPNLEYPEDADYWKQRTGNELANEFYESGDYRSALTIYQALASYSSAPAWRWPAIHQIGLCFERLGLPDRAKMAYEEILNPGGGGVEEQALNDSLVSLRTMAQWRLEHLNWEDDLMQRLHHLKTR